MTEQELHEELLKDGREFCPYCGTERYRFSCCGEVHFETYKDMSPEQQAEFRDYELLEMQRSKNDTV